MNKTCLEDKLLNKNITFFGAILVALFFAMPGYANESNKHHSSKHSSEQLNFGPWDSYMHRMSVDPSDYRHLKDISLSASEVPKPILRKRAEKISIKLNATEVISEIAPGISYHYWTFNNTIPGPFLRMREGGYG